MFNKNVDSKLDRFKKKINLCIFLDEHMKCCQCTFLYKKVKRKKI